MVWYPWITTLICQLVKEDPMACYMYDLMTDHVFRLRQAFDDKPLVSRILFLFGKLSFAEAQYGQTVNLCLEAQVR